MDKHQLAQRIRAFRKLKGYTQHQLSACMGISVGVLGAIERGSRMPDERFLMRMAELLEIDLMELIQQQNAPRRS